MAERDIVRKILKAIHDRGGWAVKVHGGPNQARTIDIHACYKGRFIGIEAKDGREVPTLYQEFVLTEIEKAAGISLVAYGPEEVIWVMNYIDRQTEHGLDGFRWTLRWRELLSTSP